MNPAFSMQRKRCDQTSAWQQLQQYFGAAGQQRAAHCLACQGLGDAGQFEENTARLDVGYPPLR